MKINKTTKFIVYKALKGISNNNFYLILNIISKIKSKISIILNVTHKKSFKGFIEEKFYSFQKK